VTRVDIAVKEIADLSEMGGKCRYEK